MCQSWKESDEWCLLIWIEMLKWDRAEKVSKLASEDTVRFERQGTWVVEAWTVELVETVEA